MMAKRISKILPYLLLAAVAIFLVWIWKQTEEFPLITDQSEPFYHYHAAKNFFDRGLLANSFLEDYATSPDAEAHPFYYTHNPDFPKLFIFVLLKLGVFDIRWYFFLAIPLFLLGQWYFYQMVSEALGKGVGLLTLLFASTNYMLSLSWGFNIVRVWTWILICGPLYHLLKKERIHTFFFYFWLALLAYYIYDLLLFFTIVVLLLKVFRVIEWSWRRLLLIWIIIPGSLFLFHQLCILHELGFEIWWQDWVYSVGNRTIGIPTKVAIQAFYDEVGLVLWGYHPIGSYQNIPKFLWDGLSQYLGFFPAFLVLLGFAVAPLLLLQKRWELPSGWKFLAVLATGMFLVFAFSPYHFHAFYSPGTSKFPLLIFFAYPFLALLITTLKKLPGPALLLGTFLILFPYGLAQYRSYRKEPPKMLPAAKVLPKYKGFSFVSNYNPPYIHYFTQNWVQTDSGFFEKDKLQNPQKYSKPDFLLCNGHCTIGGPVKVLEQSKDWMIVDFRNQNFKFMLTPSKKL